MSLTFKMNSALNLSAEKIRKQVLFAAAVAINDVAAKLKAAETKLIAGAFEHPRPFTVGSVGLGPVAKPAQLVRRVYVKDKTAVYLDAYEHGGSHYLPGRPELGKVMLEPVHIPVDVYGQIRKKQLETLLARPDVFVGQIGEVMGVWQRVKLPTRRGVLAPEMRANDRCKPRLILLARVIPNRPVPKHLGFVEQGRDLVEYLMPAAMERALTRALISAR